VGLILPPSVELDARRELALEFADSIIAEMRYWDPLLQDIDARLSLRRARAGAMGPGIFPGMWHIIRRAEGAPFTAWVISTNGLGVPGPYREMADDVLEQLRRGDLWNPARVAELNAAARRREESKARAEENHREARRDDLAVNVKAMVSPGVSLSARGATAKSRKK
jgi:hypothetical protein